MYVYMYVLYVIIYSTTTYMSSRLGSLRQARDDTRQNSVASTYIHRKLLG